MDLAIQQKQVIIPPFNNATLKSKMISLAWIAFILMVVVDMQPGETIHNSFINKLSCFVFIYFGLFLYYNKNLFHKHMSKVPWPVLYSWYIVIDPSNWSSTIYFSFFSTFYNRG